MVAGYREWGAAERDVFARLLGGEGRDDRNGREGLGRRKAADDSGSGGGDGGGDGRIS